MDDVERLDDIEDVFIHYQLCFYDITPCSNLTPTFYLVIDVLCNNMLIAKYLTHS